jgi:hypothetical protein
VTEKLERYVRLVGDGAGQEAEALELRRQLEQFLPNDPMLDSADLAMQRRQLMARLRGEDG